MDVKLKEKIEEAVGKYKEQLRMTDSFDGEKREVALKEFTTKLVSLGFLKGIHQGTVDIMMTLHQDNHELVSWIQSLQRLAPDDVAAELTEVIRRHNHSPSDLTSYPLQVVHDQIHHTRKLAPPSAMKAEDIIADKLSIGLASGDSFRTTYPSLRSSPRSECEYHVAIGTVSHEIFKDVSESIHRLPKGETLIVPRPPEVETDQEYYNPNPKTAHGYVADWYVDEHTRMIFADIVITDPGIQNLILTSPNGLASISLKPRFVRNENRITRCIHLELTQLYYGDELDIGNFTDALRSDIGTAVRLANTNTPEDAPLITQLTAKSSRPFYGYGDLEMIEGLNPMHRLYAAPHFINGKLAGKVVQVLTPKGDVDGQIRFERDATSRSRTLDALLSMIQFALVDDDDKSDSMKDQVKSLIQELRELA